MGPGTILPTEITINHASLSIVNKAKAGIRWHQSICSESRSLNKKSYPECSSTCRLPWFHIYNINAHHAMVNTSSPRSHEPPSLPHPFPLLLVVPPPTPAIKVAPNSHSYLPYWLSPSLLARGDDSDAWGDAAMARWSRPGGRLRDLSACGWGLRRRKDRGAAWAGRQSGSEGVQVGAGCSEEKGRRDWYRRATVLPIYENKALSNLAVAVFVNK
jgi:hypothetical protein